MRERERGGKRDGAFRIDCEDKPDDLSIPYSC